MRYVNPLVEGSSPSPVTHGSTRRNMSKAATPLGCVNRTRNLDPITDPERPHMSDDIPLSAWAAPTFWGEEHA